MTANKKILLIIVILAIMVGGAFYFVEKYPQITKPSEEEAPKTFGEKIYQIVQNPAEKIPQTNPFKVNINPFEGLKINPFKDVYKNPFGE